MGASVILGTWIFLEISFMYLVPLGIATEWSGVETDRPRFSFIIHVLVLDSLFFVCIALWRSWGFFSGEFGQWQGGIVLLWAIFTFLLPPVFIPNPIYLLTYPYTCALLHPPRKFGVLDMFKSDPFGSGRHSNFPPTSNYSGMPPSDYTPTPSIVIHQIAVLSYLSSILFFPFSLTLSSFHVQGLFTSTHTYSIYK